MALVLFVLTSFVICRLLPIYFKLEPILWNWEFRNPEGAVQTDIWACIEEMRHSDFWYCCKQCHLRRKIQDRFTTDGIAEHLADLPRAVVSRFSHIQNELVSSLTIRISTKGLKWVTIEILKWFTAQKKYK